MSELLDLLREPWTFEFMQRALIAAVLVSVVAAVVGSFVILKGMAFIGDALPHASCGGVAIAFALGFNLHLGGAIAALLTALSIGFIARRGSVRYDTAIGIVFISGFALGILIVSTQSGYVVDLFSFVFGNVLGVSWTDIWLTIGLGGFILIAVALFYKELLFTAYDPSMAAATGVPVAAMQYGLLALIGLTVVIALQVMGIVLVLAMLVAPPATAQLLTRRLPPRSAPARRGRPAPGSSRRPLRPRRPLHRLVRRRLRLRRHRPHRHRLLLPRLPVRPRPRPPLAAPLRPH